jgi:hypothetical protein
MPYGYPLRPSTCISIWEVKDMKPVGMNRRVLLSTTLALPTLFELLLPNDVQAQTATRDNPLPSWNDGPAKRAIIEFVQGTTTNGGSKFVPPEERIATFDQDGTLWVEHPMYTS